jgi:hypothetical protein
METTLRWNALFADLEAQAVALDQAQRAGEIDVLTRAEVAGVALADRLRAAIGATVRLSCVSGAAFGGVLARVGPDWLLLDDGTGCETVVLTAAVSRALGLGRASLGQRASATAGRLGLRSVLRQIARDRLPVCLALVDGDLVDATIDRVGADFVEVARHAGAEARRRAEVRAVEVVALSGLVAVRRRS